jgi:hypothetical protein
MPVRLSASRAGRSLPPGRFLVLISVRGWVYPRPTVRLQGLGQLKNPMTSSGIEPTTFRRSVKSIEELYDIFRKHFSQRVFSGVWKVLWWLKNIDYKISTNSHVFGTLEYAYMCAFNSSSITGRRRVNMNILASKIWAIRRSPPPNTKFTVF